LVENIIWGRGLTEGVKISLGEGTKIAQKNHHMIYERSLRAKLRRNLGKIKIVNLQNIRSPTAMWSDLHHCILLKNVCFSF